ncbi:MAG: oxidative damage protection protein [Gammaproteobacteria bacterium RIFCSPHIGHO2_12_FULL_41_15]|nr:MAG: oxidative damage protection protein [Gammaproteobacteria bacterium RIFCSPHIGHO2_12_FULL_41_15]
MSHRHIHCQKLNKEAEGLKHPPIPGALGERIFQHISAEAWKLWLEHQTMLINEYRLNLLEPSSKELLMTEMEKFLFGEGSDKPEGFIEV